MSVRGLLPTDTVPEASSLKHDPRHVLKKIDGIKNKDEIDEERSQAVKGH
jgi:hypothetical protein